MKRIVRFALIALVFGASPALAADKMNQSPGYWYDAADAVVTDSYGDCWRTRSWSPENAIEQCDPQLFERQAMTEPEPMPEEKPAPAPTVTTVPATHKAEAHFAFDSAELGMEAEASLRALLRSAQQLERVERIVLRGYADPIGPSGYNRELSRRRAEAVKGWLVDNGVKAGRIATEAHGETSEQASCSGERGQVLIQCYRPNRRVEAFVHGVKMQRM